MMDAVGLVPSDTGKDGGKRTGPRMTHYIEDGGVFEVATSALMKSGFEIPWTAILRPRNKAKTASKTKYTCGECGANAWAKPEANIWCGECDEQMDYDQMSTAKLSDLKADAQRAQVDIEGARFNVAETARELEKTND